MENIKTFFSFSDGEISDATKYDWDRSIGGTVETIKCFLSSMIGQYKLSGKILIEFCEDIYFIDYEVTPKQYEHELRHELSKRCHVFERLLTGEPKEAAATALKFEVSGRENHGPFEVAAGQINPSFGGQPLVKHLCHYLIECRMLLFKNFRLFKKVFRSNC
jgi:hypothetical protein